MTLSDDWAAAKAWRGRNGDGFNTFEKEQTQAPPAFDLTEYDQDSAAFAGLSFPAGRITPDDDGEQAHAIRHVHVYDPALVESE